MRVIIELSVAGGNPFLRLFVHDAPHRRAHRATHMAYRRVLDEAFRKAGVFLPIMVPVELHATFINPTSPDLGNVYLALERALDGAVLIDDSLIQKQTTEKMYVNRIELAPKKMHVA
jgi:hypothetical protein